MPFVHLDARTLSHIKADLQARGVKDPVRIDLRSTGCCDPSLGLCVDPLKDGDLACEADGVQFIIDPATHRTVGDVSIAFTEEDGSQGYVLTSSRPLSEWEGFGVCQIRLREED